MQVNTDSQSVKRLIVGHCPLVLVVDNKPVCACSHKYQDNLCQVHLKGKRMLLCHTREIDKSTCEDVQLLLQNHVKAKLCLCA